jgi:K+-sensing histidine kinase KdpD
MTCSTSVRWRDGSLKLDYEELKASEIVEAALMQVAPLAADKELNIQKQLAPGLPVLQADRDKLLRTLVNLLGNAIKFTPNRGSVTIEVHSHNNEMTFCVCDTGEGIPKDAFECIFEKFGQVESAQRWQANVDRIGTHVL